MKKKVTLFQAFSKVLNGFTITEHTTLDTMVVQPSPEILGFLEKLWIWTIAVPGQTPKAQVMYICTKWDIGCRMAQLSYAKSSEDWKNFKHLQNAKYVNPSSRKKHLHVSDLFWALANKYSNIVPNHLKMIFYRTKMLLYEDVLQTMQATHSDYVGVAAAAVLGGCIESTDASKLFIELLELLS